MPRVAGHELTAEVRTVFPTQLHADDLFFVCIGTDRSTGDSLGPLVGTYLEEAGYTNVIGTVEDPCHAMNLAELISTIPEGKTIIAIDACLGQVSSIGLYTVKVGPLRPGAGVNKDLPPVGDYSILGTVNVGGFMEYFVLQNTRLHLVMQLAGTIAQSLMEVYPLFEAFSEVAAAEELLV